MEETPKSFWNTLPGILTGIASTIAAVASLMAAVNRAAPPAAAPAPHAAVAGQLSAPTAVASNSNQPVKPQGCEKAVGNWDWAVVGGVVTFLKDGHLEWRKNAQDVFPTATGTWNCIDPKAQELTLFWPLTGMTDTMNLSADGRSVSGTNYTGIRLSGIKRN